MEEKNVEQKEMDQKKIQAVIEAVLFAMGDSVEMCKFVLVLEMD